MANGWRMQTSRIELRPAAATSEADPSDTNSFLETRTSVPGRRNHNAEDTYAIFRMRGSMESGGTWLCTDCANDAMTEVTFVCFGVRKRLNQG